MSNYKTYGEWCAEIKPDDPRSEILNSWRQSAHEQNKRIAELETKIRHNALWQASEDAEERAHLEKLVPDLKKRIAELEGFIGQLIEAGDAMSNAQSMWVAEEDIWDALVKDWKEREKNG